MDQNLKYIYSLFKDIENVTITENEILLVDDWKYLEKAIKYHPIYAEAYHNLGWVLLNIKGQDGQVENCREMLSAYSKATELYAKEQKLPMNVGIKQAFQLVGLQISDF